MKTAVTKFYVTGLTTLLVATLPLGRVSVHYSKIVNSLKLQ